MKKILTASIIVLLIGLVIAGILFLANVSRSVTLNKHISAGESYLSENRIDLAINEFTQALNIDGNSADAYYGLVDAYYKNGSLDLAKDYAQTGFENTSDYRLRNYIKLIKKDMDELRFQELSDLPLYIKEAVCAYYDLISQDEITLEMYDSIETLTLTVYKVEVKVSGGLKVYMDASINNSYLGVHSTYVRTNRFVEKYINSIDNEFERERLNSFYVLLDPNDQRHTTKTIEEMYKAFPIIKDVGAVYVGADLTLKERERANKYIDTYIFSNPDEFFVGDTVDLTLLDLLPNIKKVQYRIDRTFVEGTFEDIGDFKNKVKISFVNCPVEITETVDDVQW